MLFLFRIGSDTYSQLRMIFCKVCEEYLTCQVSHFCTDTNKTIDYNFIRCV